MNKRQARRADVIFAASLVGLLIAVGGAAGYLLGDHSPKALAAALGGVLVMFLAQVVSGLLEDK